MYMPSSCERRNTWVYVLYSRILYFFFANTPLYCSSVIGYLQLTCTTILYVTVGLIKRTEEDLGRSMTRITHG
jgi:hypothetical protein